MGKLRAIALHIILGDALLIHPQAQALIADELDHPNSFINGGILPLGASHLVFVDEHCLLPFRAFSAILIIHHNYGSCKRHTA